MNQYFHFTIGPVQGFVAQARRTRDYWAGSFLLSWLAGVAMASIRHQGGQIVFPTPPAGYLGWIHGKGSGDPPRQGVIPNRFKALQAQVPPGFKPEQVVADVRAAWKALADLVWDRDLAGLTLPPATASIWKRQVESFWEISWCLSEDEKANDLLDRRKNWRVHLPPDEPGLKCKMTAGYQEISGATSAGAPEYQQLWKPLANRLGLDLKENEHLCAIAFIKRRFSRCFDALEAALPSGLRIRGWKVPVNVPSAGFIAAVHWLEALMEKMGDGETHLQEWVREFGQAGIDRSEDPSVFPCLSRLFDTRPPQVRIALSYDATVYHDIDPGSHEAPRRFIRKLAQRAGLPKTPSPFYAVLLMDGDSLGALLQKLDPRDISRALEQFTNAVPEIVRQHNGFLVYAGGDDVLALFPLEDVLGCSARLRTAYHDAFRQAGIDVKKHHIGISAAVMFTHIKNPLRRILLDIHSLLDDVAKDQTGRDALAVQIRKPGGKMVEWAIPWARAIEGDRLILENIADQFRSRDEEEIGFSNKFFFKIRERFTLFDPKRRKGRPTEDEEQNRLTEDEEQALLVADFLNAAENRRKGSQTQLRNAAETLVKELLDQCREHRRKLDQGQETFSTSPGLRDDGAMLIRFLASKGMEA